MISTLKLDRFGVTRLCKRHDLHHGIHFSHWLADDSHAVENFTFASTAFSRNYSFWFTYVILFDFVWENRYNDLNHSVGWLRSGMCDEWNKGGSLLWLAGGRTVRIAKHYFYIYCIQQKLLFLIHLVFYALFLVDKPLNDIKLCCSTSADAVIMTSEVPYCDGLADESHVLHRISFVTTVFSRKCSFWFTYVILCDFVRKNQKH